MSLSCHLRVRGGKTRRKDIAGLITKKKTEPFYSLVLHVFFVLRMMSSTSFRDLS